MRGFRPIANYFLLAGLLLFFAACQRQNALQPTPISIPAATLLPTPTLRSALAAAPTQRAALDVSLDAKLLGYSTNGLPLTAYQIGSGSTRIVLVSGIHGGYEWNTILLAYELLDHFDGATLPEDISIIVIPSANPDGQRLITGTHNRFMASDVTTAETRFGRFNGNGVDLNRNWDCQWQREGVWQSQTVSGGSVPFSESETRVLRDYLIELQPAVTVFYHSAANGVFTAQCHGEQAADTLQLSTLYARAADYPLYTDFSAYLVTGDASDYLSTLGLAAFTVELRNQSETDFSRNLAGIEALIEQLSP